MPVAEAQPQATGTKKETIKVTVCLSLSGLAEGGMEVFKEFEKQIAEHQADAEIPFKI